MLEKIEALKKQVEAVEFMQRNKIQRVLNDMSEADLKDQKLFLEFCNEQGIYKTV